MSTSNRKPGAESVPSGVGGSAAAGAAPLSGSLRVHAPRGTLVRLNGSDVPLEQRDRILPCDGRVDLEFPDMQRVEITGTAYARIGCALELLKHGQTITAISEIDSALRDARRRFLEHDPLPTPVSLLLTQLKVMCAMPRVNTNSALKQFLRSIDDPTLEQLNNAQCVELVSRLASVLKTLRGAQ